MIGMRLPRPAPQRIYGRIPFVAGNSLPMSGRGRRETIIKEVMQMLQDLPTLYKLIVLYMLDRAKFPMTNAQVSDYILEKEYTNYLSLQQTISELTEAHMVSQETIRNRTHLSITAEGRETLGFFQNLINYGIKQDIDAYFRE